MKKMIEYLDADRERVRTYLQGELTPARAQEVLEKEADRLLLQYNEECKSERMRDAASGMMQALRSSLPLLDSAGEVQVWRREGMQGEASGSAAGGKGRLPAILLVIGIVLSAAAFAGPALAAGGTAAAGTLLHSIFLPAAGGVCLYLAGRAAGRAGKDFGGDLPAERTEVLVDPDKVWSALRGTVMVIARSLESLQEREKADRRRSLAAAAGGRGISTEEVELFSGLLENAAADSPQMAADLRFYLHKKGVDVLPWSEQNAAWFEQLPAVPAVPAGTSSSKGKSPQSSGEAQAVITIRPALVQEGKLLKKGVAVK